MSVNLVNGYVVNEYLDNKFVFSDNNIVYTFPFSMTI